MVLGGGVGNFGGSGYLRAKRRPFKKMTLSLLPFLSLAFWLPGTDHRTAPGCAALGRRLPWVHICDKLTHKAIDYCCLVAERSVCDDDVYMPTLARIDTTHRDISLGAGNAQHKMA